MLFLLVGVEGFALYRILSETWEISRNFFYLYRIFVGLMIIIEEIGCLSVRKSIKNHSSSSDTTTEEAEKCRKKRYYRDL
jgi:hypothetical protein